MIYIDNNLIYSSIENPYDLYNGEIQLEHNSIGKFEFKTVKEILVRPLKSIVKVMRGDECIFQGRIIDCDKKLYWNEYIAEGLIGFLNDTYFKITQEKMAAQELFSSVISNHNAKSDFKFRTFVTGLSGTVELNKGYIKSYEILNKITELAGGFFYCVENEIKYSKEPLRENNQPLQLGENLLDEHIKGNFIDIKTIVICSNDKREVIVQNDAAIEKYGKIYDYISSNSDDLRKEAQDHLDVVSSSLRTLELSAADLSLIDANFDSYRLYDNVRIINKLHGIDVKMMVNQLHFNIHNPVDNTISFGKKVELFSNDNRSVTVADKKQLEKQIISIKSNSNTVAKDGKSYEWFIDLVDGKPIIRLREIKEG